MGIKISTISDILVKKILKENLMPKMSDRLQKIGHIVLTASINCTCLRLPAENTWAPVFIAV